jgi:ribonuclease HI
VLLYRSQVKEISGAEPATTNNRMEIQAAMRALAALKEPCAIEFFTDSEYLRMGITQHVKLWKRTGWKTKQKEPVKNRDLWTALDQLTAGHQITWTWLKGHAGHAENERCDLLARQAIGKLKKQHTPEQLGKFLEEFRRGGPTILGAGINGTIGQGHPAVVAPNQMAIGGC